MDTHFENPSGIHHDNHYSTAYDLALIGNFAMNNPTFRKIVATSSFTLPATEQYPRNDRTFKVTNELMRSGQYHDERAIGVKTGYTQDAKNCLVAAAKQGDLEILTVTLGSEQLADGSSQRYIDTKTLFDYAFTNYTVKTVQNENSIVKHIEIRGATKETKNLGLVAKESVPLFMTMEDSNKTIEPEITLNKKLKAPIAKGDVVGTAKYTMGESTYTIDLLAETEVEKDTTLEILLLIIALLLVIYLLYRLLFGKSKKKKSRKRDRFKLYS